MRAEAEDYTANTDQIGLIIQVSVFFQLYAFAIYSDKQTMLISELLVCSTNNIMQTIIPRWRGLCSQKKFL